MQKLAHILVALTLFWCSAVRAELPARADEYVNDYAHVLSPQTRDTLRQRLRTIEQSTDVEIVVATIESMDRHGSFDRIEDFARRLFDRWGVGNQPRNRGVLLIVSKSDRKVRVELGAGYPALFNPVMKRVVERKLVPALRAGNYDTGATQGVDAIIAATTNPIALHDGPLLRIVAGLMLVSLLVGIYARLTGRTGLAWVCFGIVATILLLVFLLLAWLASLVSDDDDEDTASGSSGTSGSGGLGGSIGSGGGFSGGGGATGSF